MHVRITLQKIVLVAFAICSSLLAGSSAIAQSQAGFATKQPNIVVIMGDDIGIWNIGGSIAG